MENEQLIPTLINILKIKKKYLDIAFNDVGKIKAWKTKKICNGQITLRDWDGKIFREVFLKAIDLQAEAMRKKSMPIRYRSTVEARAKYKDQNNQKIRQFLNGRQLIEKITPNIEIVSTIGNVPKLEKLNFSWLRELEEEIPKVKGEFFKMPPEHAYIVSRNTEAFSKFLDSSVSEFYKHISQMNQTEKKGVRDWLFIEPESFTIGEVVSLLNSSAIQQWLRISKPQYRKAFLIRQSNERKKQKSKTTKWADEADRVLMEEAWKLFFDDTWPHLYSDDGGPIDMIRNTTILEHGPDIELIIGFLCCPLLQEKILNKLRKW